MELVEQCRELGKARLALVAKCTAENSFKTDWQPPRQSFPITWGDCWKSVFEVPTNDYVGDLGFFMDVLGLDVNTISDDYVMLISPDLAFSFSLVPATAERPAPSPDSIRLEFMAQAIDVLAVELAKRSIDVGSLHAEWGADQKMRTMQFRSPSGLQVKIWGFVAGEEA